VIFREFYPRGLTAVDDLDEATLGTRPTMSHVTARMEMENLLSAVSSVDAANGEIFGRSAARELLSALIGAPRLNKRAAQGPPFLFR